MINDSPLIQDFLRYLKTVVQVQNETTSTGGYAPLSWSGLRHMLSEVIDPLSLSSPFSLPFSLLIHPYILPSIFVNWFTLSGVLWVSRL